MISDANLILLLTLVVLILTAIFAQWLDTAARIRERVEIESEFLSDEE